MHACVQMGKSSRAAVVSPETATPETASGTPRTVQGQDEPWLLPDDQQLPSRWAADPSLPALCTQARSPLQLLPSFPV